MRLPLDAVITIKLPCAALSHLGKEQLFLLDLASPERRTCLEWVLSYLNTLEIPSAYSAFGSVGDTLAYLEELPR